MKILCHNPCFNRIIYAIVEIEEIQFPKTGHNPCFNRIIFAIDGPRLNEGATELSQSLF